MKMQIDSIKHRLMMIDDVFTSVSLPQLDVIRLTISTDLYIISFFCSIFFYIF